MGFLDRLLNKPVDVFLARRLDKRSLARGSSQEALSAALSATVAQSYDATLTVSS
jgi:hypothetical protein